MDLKTLVNVSAQSACHHLSEARIWGFKRGFITLMLAALLSGCETLPTAPQPINQATTSKPAGTDAVAIRSVKQGLRLARLSREPLASAYRAKAARLALDANRLTEAERILKTVDVSMLNEQSLVDFMIVEALIALDQDRPTVALASLNRTNQGLTHLSQQDQVDIGLAKAMAYEQTGRALAAAQERVLVSPLLTAEAQTDNHEQLFSSLTALPTNLLKNYAEKAVTNDLRGWLSLAAMTKQFQNKPSQQQKSLSRWKRLWVGHPAAIQLPMELALLDSIVAGQPSKIAILLPQTGPLAKAGNAILSGLLAAHFEQGQESELLIYDSHQWESSLELLAKAQSEGAEFAVGPLDKTRVAELSEARLGIPVLALNRPPQSPRQRSRNGNLFFFSLAPEDEARQIAEHSMQTGLNNILLIAPNNDWGDRTTNAFRNSIAESADLNVVERRFEDGESYLPFVRSVLGVDQSQTRANELKRITGKTFEFTPRRRQDIDMIGLLANNAQARQINPALAFYYADDLPVFATSLVNDDQASKISNLDLNGIRFCDMPWKRAPSSAFAEHLQLLLPGASSSLVGLFALGTDAFNVIPRLKQLRELESLSFYGFTGKLSMEDQTLVRSLMWGSFEQGEVLTVPTIVESI